MLLKTSVLVLAGLAAGQAAAQCYTVYDRDNRVVYSGRQAPVDMSKPLHQTVPGLFPGGHLVFDNLGPCGEVAASPAPDTSRMGAAPAAPPKKVITEFKNPPLRVIQEGDRLTIEGMGAAAL